ncbi:hypothetical protein [Clostridium saccharoperbutylacetonicum]|jgi:hypothetical protein
MFYLFLDLIKSQTTEDEFKKILKDTDNDITFNRVYFWKTTNLKEYIRISQDEYTKLMQLKESNYTKANTSLQELSIK